METHKTETEENWDKREDRQSLVYVASTTSGQEMDLAYALMPAACMGPTRSLMHSTVVKTVLSEVCCDVEIWQILRFLVMEFIGKCARFRSISTQFCCKYVWVYCECRNWQWKYCRCIWRFYTIGQVCASVFFHCHVSFHIQLLYYFVFSTLWYCWYSSLCTSGLMLLLTRQTLQSVAVWGKGRCTIETSVSDSFQL